MAVQRYEIERRTDLSYEEFAREYLYPLKPVIITDVLNGWPALKRWSPEFFRTEFGDMTFSLNDAEYAQASYDAKNTVEYTMARFIDLVLESTEEKPAPYFRNKILYDLFPTLKHDVGPLPEYLRPNWLSDRYLIKRVADVLNRGAALELFIGGRGTKFPVLHYDGAATHAVLIQIYGRKQYLVYPPEQEPYLYPSPQKPNHSAIDDIEKPDLMRFPLFAKARAITFYLEPGEFLFVPSHWWHTVKILTPSITLSTNILNQSNWHELKNYVAGQQPNLMLAMASRAYLTCAGAWRSWRDRKWRKRVFARTT